MSNTLQGTVISLKGYKTDHRAAAVTKEPVPRRVSLHADDCRDVTVTPDGPVLSDQPRTVSLYPGRPVLMEVYAVGQGWRANVWGPLPKPDPVQEASARFERGRPLVQSSSSRIIVAEPDRIDSLIGTIDLGAFIGGTATVLGLCQSRAIDLAGRIADVKIDLDSNKFRIEVGSDPFSITFDPLQSSAVLSPLIITFRSDRDRVTVQLTPA